MIEVSELRKSYGSVVAVDGISFEARSGEIFGRLGQAIHGVRFASNIAPITDLRLRATAASAAVARVYLRRWRIEGGLPRVDRGAAL